MLLGEKTSGNHQAYRRGHLDITILKGLRRSAAETNSATVLIKTVALCLKRWRCTVY